MVHYVNASSILSVKNGMNVYRGCSHGCIYCDSRSVCCGMAHPFTDIEVKQNAPELLESALRRKRTRCMIGTGSMSDPYLPLEAEAQITRRCLEIILKHGFGCTVLTKSNLILRDLDLLQALHEKTRCVVQMTVTTIDDDLCRLVEPCVCPTSERLAVLAKLQQLGIPTIIWLCPILPFINDTADNINGILDACFERDVKGILCFGMGVTLREGNREYFYEQLDRSFPGLKQQYHQHFGLQYQCSSPNEQALMRIFHDRCRQQGVMTNVNEIFAYLNVFEDPFIGKQLSLFD